jgi:AcrR family transcriptional regulator
VSSARQHNPLEPRAARTSRALQDALFVLLADTDLADITVAQLCREADVHRTTFYGHYPTIEAFASDMFADMLDDLADVGGSPERFDDVDAEEVSRAYGVALVEELQHILDNRSVYRRLFALTNDAGFRRTLGARMRGRADLAVEVWRRHGLALDSDPDVLAAHVAGGLVGTLELWAASDRTDIDAFTAAIVDTMPPWWPRVTP